MTKANVLLIGGLFIFMLGVFLSIQWIVVGTLFSVAGGLIMGSSSYFMGKKAVKRQ
ncbi:hypothetical protein [Rossellomorea sp. DUT-2]|uniref:hypothetical protein n=1 Tax=Rossellomorea sp. DUT-2 TaxID=3412021 RepID=UPI003D169278